jgi:hypothetical protein
MLLFGEPVEVIVGERGDDAVGETGLRQPSGHVINVAGDSCRSGDDIILLKNGNRFKLAEGVVDVISLNFVLFRNINIYRNGEHSVVN